MYFGERAPGMASLVLLALMVADVYGQEPAASPSPQSAAGANVAATKPAPEPDDFWTRETMTGDWGGTRSRWKEKGIELEFKLSNSVQGIASGGADNDTEYNAKFEMEWKFDLGKVAGWKYWQSEIKTEVRWSGPLLAGTGGINPTNTAVITPQATARVSPSLR